MIGEIPLHIVLLALSLDGRLKRDKPHLIIVDDRVEVAPPDYRVPKKSPSKKRSIFFIGDDK